MTGWTSRRVVTALVLELAVPAALMLPAEHVHGADGERPSAVVHRHAALHDADADHHHDGIALSHGEDHVTWLPAVFVGQETFTPAAPFAAPETITSIAPAVLSTSAHAPAGVARSHGPPRRPQQLRGPPTLPV